MKKFHWKQRWGISQGFIARSIHDIWMRSDRDLGDIWIYADNLKQEQEENQTLVTREEALAWTNKHADSEIFIERNCSSLKTEDQIHRIAMIKEYIKENLK